MRRLMLVCSVAAAASAASMAGTAHAEGVYVAVEGGAYLQKKLDYNFIGLDNFFASKYRTGIDVDGALGYDFEGIRVELQVGYKRADANRFGFQIEGSPVATQRGSAVSGNSHVFSGMLNAYYDITQSRIQPYIGGGVGVADVVSDHVGFAGFGDSGVFLDKSDIAFAFQAMGGVRARLTSHVTAGVGYRYFEVPHVRLDVFNTTAKTKLRSSSILGTLTYEFGTPYSERPLVLVPPPAAIAEASALPPPVPPAPLPTGFTISFAVGGSALSADARASLDKAAAAYRRVGHASVMLASPAETAGPTVYNEKLSARRAGVTRDYLVAKGTPRDAVTVQSFDSATGAAVAPAAHPRGSVDITFGPGSGQ